MYGHPTAAPMFNEACDPLPYHHRNVATLQVNDDNVIHNKHHPQQQQQYYGGRYRSMSSNNFDHLAASGADKMMRISPLLIDCNQNIDTHHNDPLQQQPSPASSHPLHHQQRSFADHSAAAAAAAAVAHSKLAHGTTRGTPGVSSSSEQQRCSSNNVVDEKYTGVCRMAGNSRNEYFITHAATAVSSHQQQQPHVQGRSVACRNPRWVPRESDQYNNYQYHYYQHQQQQHQQQQQQQQAQSNRIVLLNEHARRLSPLSSSTFGPGQSCFNERPSSRWMLSQESDVQHPAPLQQHQQTAVAAAASYRCVVGNDVVHASTRCRDETTKKKKLAMFKVTTQLRQLRMDLNQIRSSTMDFKREIEADFARLNSLIANKSVTRKTTGSDPADEALIPNQTPLSDQEGNQIQQRYEQKSDLLQLPNKCNRVSDVSSRLSSLSGGGGSPPSRCSTSSLPMVNCALLETPDDHVSMMGGRQGLQPHQESECSVDSGYQDQFGSILMSRASGIPLHSPIVETPPAKSDTSTKGKAETSTTTAAATKVNPREEGRSGYHQSCHLTAPPSGSCYRNEAWLETSITSPHASSEWLDISQVISPEIEAATDRCADPTGQVRPVPKERKTLKKSKSDFATRPSDEMSCDAKNVRTSTSADNTDSNKKEARNHRVASPSAQQQQQQRKIKLGVSAINVSKNQKESVKKQQSKKEIDDNGKEAREVKHEEKKKEVKEEAPPTQQQEVIRRRSMRMMTELQIYELDELGFTRPVVENVTTSGNPSKKTKSGDSKKEDTDASGGQKKRKNQNKKRDECSQPCSTSPPTILDNPQSMVISQSWDIYRVGSPEDVRRPRARLPHAFSLSPDQQYASIESPQPLPRKSNQLIGSACASPSRVVDSGEKTTKEGATSGATNAFVGASVMSAFSPVLSTSLFSLNSLGESEGGNFKRRTSLPLSSRKSQFYDQHVRPLVAEAATAKDAASTRGASKRDGKGTDSRKSRRSHPPPRQRHQSAEEDLRSEASLHQQQQQQRRRYGDYCDNHTSYNDGGFPHHARTLSAFVTPTNPKEFVQRKLPKYHELPVKRSNQENGIPEHTSRVGNSSTEAVSDRKQQNRSALTASINKHTYQRENVNGQTGYDGREVAKSGNKNKTTSAVSMFKANFISRKMKAGGDQSLRKSYNPRDRSSTASTSSTETPASSKLKAKATAPSTKLKKSFYNGGGKKVTTSTSSYGDVDSSFEEPLTSKTQSTKSRGAMQRIRNSFRNPRQKTKMFGTHQQHSISEHQNSKRKDEYEATSRTNLGIQLFLDSHKSSTQQQQQQQSSVGHPGGNISYV